MLHGAYYILFLLGLSSLIGPAYAQDKNCEYTAQEVSCVAQYYTKAPPNSEQQTPYRIGFVYDGSSTGQGRHITRITIAVEPDLEARVEDFLQTYSQQTCSALLGKSPSCSPQVRELKLHVPAALKKYLVPPPAPAP